MHYGDPRRPRVVIVGRDGRCRYEFLVLDEEHPPEHQLVEFAVAQQRVIHAAAHRSAANDSEFHLLHTNLQLAAKPGRGQFNFDRQRPL